VTEEDVARQVRQAVADLAEIDVAEVDTTTGLGWLAFDEADKDTLSRKLERDLGIAPPRGGASSFDTVQDLIDHVLSQLRQQA
jgi:acyl carrier protein